MKKQSLLFYFSFCIFLFSSCKKINEATELGANLIPTVDNVTTFETVLNVETFNERFLSGNDSVRSSISDEHFLGYIGNDPLFGKTTASIFLQLKPPTDSIQKFLFQFQNTGNTLINLDSVVLITNYIETYGDTTLPQSVQVFEIDKTTNFRSDSVYLIGKNDFPPSTASLSTVKIFVPKDLDDSVLLRTGERVARQLRIPLTNSFGTRIFNYKTADAFSSDSAFNSNFKGFEIRPVGSIGNAVLGFDLLSRTNTKLGFYYKYKTGGKDSTIVEYFTVTTRSASANYINRDYIGSKLQSALGATADNLLYLQNSPGTYAKVKIPGLSAMSNAIVHRAELIVQQVYDASDNRFAPPAYLFLDAYDSSKSNYRTIPFDLTFNSANNTITNAVAFGMIGRKRSDNQNNPIMIWNFDVSRYIQHVLNKTWPYFDLRLSAPYYLKDINSTSSVYSNSSTEKFEFLPINPSPVKGRVQVGGGSHLTQPMKLRIVYSKI